MRKVFKKNFRSSSVSTAGKWVLGGLLGGCGQKEAFQSAVKMIWPGVQGSILLFLLDLIFVTISKVNFMKSDVHQNLMNAKELYNKWKKVD